MKIHYFFLLLILLAVISCTQIKQEKKSIIARQYCTEIGRFDMLFYEGQVSGSYALLPKKSLGSIWGHLDGNKLTGRWIDEDGSGDIIIKFNEDFSWFTTNYRSDDELEKWYKDQWHGALRTGNKSQFTQNALKYQCE
jgi:hypothetical protein